MVRTTRTGRRPPPAPDQLPGGLGPALPADPAWQLTVEGGAATRQRVEESWLCVADGRVGTRGSLEEDGAGSVPLVVAAGVYDGQQHLLAVPSWVTVPNAEVRPAGRRVLDLRDGTVLRSTTGGGEAAPSALHSLRFACLARPGTGVLVGDIDTPGRPAAAAGDGPVTDTVERSSPLGGGVLAMTSTEHRRRPDGGRTLVRLVAHVAEPRRRPGHRQAAARLAEAAALGPVALLDEQRRAWAARWAATDVAITADPDLTRAVRFGLWHVMASVADHDEAAVGARGLSGPAYAGHVFWDADVFVLPLLAATHPAAARAVLEYRVRRLPAARRAAAVLGREGARFPWESAADGTDVTPREGIDANGQHVPILNGRLEEHITADVAWAAWSFASWAGDWSFLDGAGRDLVLDTARYWASRLRQDDDGRAHIDGVIGPDEYHEDVDDNAFTNVMAAWNLRRAAELARRSGDPAGGESDRWEDLAGRLVTGADPGTGRTEQFAGYDNLTPVLAASLGTPPFAGDLVLGRPRLGRSQLVKQADVLMLHHMVPEAMAPGSMAVDLDYYLPRTSHGSSLSPSIHAALLARAGRIPEARSMLELAVRIDLDDLTATAADGLHLANLGGIWQALVHGFAGVSTRRPDDPVLTLDPHVPDDWGELQVRFGWHGRAVALRCTSSAVHVGTDLPLTVDVGGRTVDVDPPGRWIP